MEDALALAQDVDEMTDAQRRAAVLQLRKLLRDGVRSDDVSRHEQGMAQLKMSGGGAAAKSSTKPPPKPLAPLIEGCVATLRSTKTGEVFIVTREPQVKKSSIPCLRRPYSRVHGAGGVFTVSPIFIYIFTSFMLTCVPTRWYPWCWHVRNHTPYTDGWTRFMIGTSRPSSNTRKAVQAPGVPVGDGGGGAEGAGAAETVAQPPVELDLDLEREMAVKEAEEHHATIFYDDAKDQLEFLNHSENHAVWVDGVACTAKQKESRILGQHNVIEIAGQSFLKYRSIFLRSFLSSLFSFRLQCASVYYALTALPQTL